MSTWYNPMVVDAIACDIGHVLRKYGRMNVVDTKEKYGTARVYCNFGLYGLHSIIWPGYVYIQWKYAWMTKLDRAIGVRITNLLNYIVVPYQEWLYRKVYTKYIQLYPMYKDALLDGADWKEVIEGEA